jgi:hypothetical protein
VAESHLGSLLGTAGLECYDRCALPTGSLRRQGKGGNIGQTLDVEADRRDAPVAGQCLEHPGHVDIGLIADREHRGDRQRAAGHSEIDSDVA